MIRLSRSRNNSTTASPRIVTVRRKAARIVPAGLLADTPEELQRRADAADALAQAGERGDRARNIDCGSAAPRAQHYAETSEAGAE